MHELSIAAAIADTADRTARRHGAGAVEEVRVRIGELSGVVPDALRFCFRLAAEGTLAAGAALVIDPVPAEAACDRCARRFPAGSPPVLLCPGCDRPADRLVAGRELEVTAVRLPAGTPECTAGTDPDQERTSDVPERRGTAGRAGQERPAGRHPAP